GDRRRIDNVAYVLSNRRLNISDLQVDHFRKRVALPGAVVQPRPLLVQLCQFDEQAAEQRVVNAKGGRRHNFIAGSGFQAVGDVLIVLQLNLKVGIFGFKLVEVGGQRLRRSTDIDHIAPGAKRIQRPFHAPEGIGYAGELVVDEFEEPQAVLVLLIQLVVEVHPHHRVDIITTLLRHRLLNGQLHDVGLFRYRFNVELIAIAFRQRHLVVDTEKHLGVGFQLISIVKGDAETEVFTLERFVDIEYLLDIHNGHLTGASVREHIVGRHILSLCLYHVLGTREPFDVDRDADHLVYRRIQLNGERRVAIVFRLLEILFSIIGYPEVQPLDGAFYIRI